MEDYERLEWWDPDYETKHAKLMAKYHPDADKALWEELNREWTRDISEVSDSWIDDEYYNRINLEQLDLAITEASEGNYVEMAFFLFEICESTFRYKKTMGWWYWNGLIWTCNGEPQLDFIIDSVVAKLVENSKNPSKETIRKCLQMPEYKNRIKKLSELYFVKAHEVLESKLDMKKHLIAFKNGVYDTHHKIFRKAKPNDYLSQFRNYNFE